MLEKMAVNPNPTFVTTLVLIYLIFTVSKINGTTYTAGVVEFASDVLQPSESPPELILRNAQRYVDIISTAATHGVDIVVFPECGLTSIKIPVVRQMIPPYLTEIPNIGVNPCDVPEAPKVLKLLSCAARNNRIYTVFNLDELVHCTSSQPDCPSDGSLFYNTNIAVDRNGMIISKYRKYNLFVEPEFNITKKPDLSWFDTDFGVRFGMFICFDILFREPAYSLVTQNISNFVYSTAWFSELPFLTAVSVQAGWAYANDVNLLASGYSNITNKNGGSGIFAGRDGKLIQTMPLNSSTMLLIARINSAQRGVQPTTTEEISFSNNNSAWDFFHDSLENYKTIAITDESAHLEYKNDGFNCNVTAELSTTNSGPTYRLVAFSGIRSYAVKTVYIEVCGVVACANSNLDSCGYRPSFHSSNTIFSKVSISASSNKQLISYPITLDKELLSFSTKDFQFKSQKINEKDEMTMGIKNSIRNFLTFALFRG